MRIIKKGHSFDLDDFIKNHQEWGFSFIYEGGLDKCQPHFFKIREQLIKEQGYICCYCQQRIDLQEGQLPKMKLEHFKPKGKEQFDKLELDYKNFLAACLGKANGQEHCDKLKHGGELKNIPNPASKEFERFKIRYIRYERQRTSPSHKEWDGYVLVAPYSEKLQENDPLTGTNEGCLNLNHQTLKSRRGSAWKGVLLAFNKKCGDKKEWHTEKGQQVANDLIKNYESPNENGQLKEFCQVIIDSLKEEFLNTKPRA